MSASIPMADDATTPTAATDDAPRDRDFTTPIEHVLAVADNIDSVIVQAEIVESCMSGPSQRAATDATFQLLDRIGELRKAWEAYCEETELEPPGECEVEADETRGDNDRDVRNSRCHRHILRTDSRERRPE